MKTTAATATLLLISATLERAPQRRPTALLVRPATQHAASGKPGQGKPPSASLGPKHECLASWYDAKRSHVRMWGTELLVAHRTLRPGTRLRVWTKWRSVTVTVCGWGPAKWTGRDLDLSRAAFARLAPTSRGVIRVWWVKER